MDSAEAVYFSNQNQINIRLIRWQLITHELQVNWNS